MAAFAAKTVRWCFAYVFVGIAVAAPPSRLREYRTVLLFFLKKKKKKEKRGTPDRVTKSARAIVRLGPIFVRASDQRATAFRPPPPSPRPNVFTLNRSPDSSEALQIYVDQMIVLTKTLI